MAISSSYLTTVLSMKPKNLIRVFPLYDRIGQIARDFKKQKHGLYSGPTLSYAPFKNSGIKIARFNGVSNTVNIKNSLTDFSSLNGAVMVWAKKLNAWVGDGVIRSLIHIRNDNNNYLSLDKLAGSTSLRAVYRGSAVNKTFNFSSGGTTDWFCVVLNWNNTSNGGDGELNTYFNNTYQDTVSLGGKYWASNTVNNANVGSLTGTNNFWNGLIGYVSIWDAPLTASEINRLYKAVIR